MRQWLLMGERLMNDKEQAHALLDRIPDDQLNAAVRFLEFLLLDPLERALATAPPEDEPISEEEEQSVARSKDWSRQNEGTSFEKVVAELGFTMDQIRNHKASD
jgi:hypothetical protein